MHRFYDAVYISCQAALNGEEWKAPSLAWGPGATKEKSEQLGHTLPEAPSRPPPRPPQQKDAPTDAPPRLVKS